MKVQHRLVAGRSWTGWCAAWWSGGTRWRGVRCGRAVLGRSARRLTWCHRS